MNIANIRISKGYGGAENYICYIFKSLSQNKDINVLHITNNIRLFNNLNTSGLNAKYINRNIDEVGTKKEIFNLILNIGEYINSYFKIISIIKNYDTEVVILHSMTEKLLLTPLFNLLGYKVIWYEHGPLYSSTRTTYIKVLYKYVSKFAKKIFVVSKDTKKDLVSGGVFKNKIVVVYIGIDLKRFEVKNVAKKSEIHIGYLGNLNAQKGIERFLKVAELLLSEKKLYRFIIIGEGKEKYINSINSKERRYYTFIGYTSRVEQYLENIDILFFPTEHYEGIPLSILESMALKICVVSKKIGGIKEIINHNYDGILYNQFDANKCKNILSTLSFNTVKRNNIQENARKKIEIKFNIDIQSKYFYNLLISL